MAASPSHISKEKLTDDFLSCSLCLESYKKPKVLHCQHTFCLPCLQRMMEICTPGMILSCPICRENTVISSGDLSSLKTNFMVESLLSFVAKSTSDHDRSLEWSGQKIAEHCQLCEERKKAVTYCDDCKVWLCGTCTVPHNKLPATKMHRTLSVSDILAKAKENLKAVEKDLQELQGKIDAKHQGELMDQNFMSEQMSLVASQIETFSEKLVAIITEKKIDLLQEVAIKVSQTETKQSLKIAQLKESSQRIKKGLEIVKDVRKSEDVYHVTNMMGNVEALRKLSVAEVTLSPEKAAKKEIEFQAVESLTQMVQSSGLGNIHSAALSVEYAPMFPWNRETDGELLHRLAYDFYITGLACTNRGVMFVASNYNSLKKLGHGFCEVDVYNVTKPWGVLKLPSSEFIVTDCGKNFGCGSVNLFDTDGKFVRMIAMGLSLPRGIAVDSHGRVYVCDENDKCVYVMTSEGRIVHIIKFTWDGKLLFDAPRYVAINTENHIYVSDGGKFVKIFDDTFQLKRTYTSPFARSDFWDVVTDDADVVFIADWTHGIHVLNSEGDFQGLLKQPANHVVIKEPTALCVHESTKALMVGTSNGEVIAVKSM